MVIEIIRQMKGTIPFHTEGYNLVVEHAFYDLSIPHSYGLTKSVPKILVTLRTTMMNIYGGCG